MDPTTASIPEQGNGTEEVMAAYSIECVPVKYFHWNGYRYTTLKDAIAAAKRAPARAITAGA